jgi:selenocysteine-specific elongation factor
LKQLILGTAGHIDHGKTSLVKAISGINTDRLKEEQERGITIELGFASLDLPSGQRLGIIDVPGHEKFVKNMVAGATGIDIVAMVIAADEGVMPQTREHMEICSLLGIRHGLVVLTKVDLVDEEWRELVIDDLTRFVHGTFLEGAPVVPVSAVTGQGIPEFIRTLDELTARLPERVPSDLFRLPIDRVFTMKGFGTVITGTLISGQVQVGDTVMVYPTGISSKVRGLQVHNESVAAAAAGMRTAVNFQGLDKSAVERGETLALPGTLKSSYMLDTELMFLSSSKKPLKNRTRIRFHAGTSEVLGNVVLLDREELAPGETAVAQLRLDAPLALVRGDRFVVRSYSPVRTIGGGQVLNPIPAKHKRFRIDLTAGLAALAGAAPEALILHHAAAAGYEGVSFADLRLMVNQPVKALDRLLQALLSSRTLLQTDKESRTYVHAESFTRLRTEIHACLAAYHRLNPLKSGMPKEEVKSKFPALNNAKLLNMVFSQMVKEGEVAAEEENLRLSGHTVSLAADEEDLQGRILAAYAQGALQPPYFTEVCKTMGVAEAKAREVLGVLARRAELVKVKEDLYFHAAALEALKTRLVAFLTANGEIGPPQFKELTGGASRKYLIPLFEFFDSRNVTIRVGDTRRLRSG